MKSRWVIAALAAITAGAAGVMDDRAVLAAYGLAPDTPEPEIVAHLFKLYADKVKCLDNQA